MQSFILCRNYIQPDVLDDLGLLHFDDWQKTFSQVVTSEELDSSGVNYALLMSFYKQNADIITNEDMNIYTTKNFVINMIFLMQ